MKKYTIFFIFLLSLAAGVQAQYTGGIGRGDFNQDNGYRVMVSNAHASSNGSYMSLKEAFDAINLRDQTGFNITVTIVDNTSETASAVLNAGLWTTLSIYPTMTNLSITGNLATPLIDLNGADNVTIDGRVNATGSSKDLVITNTSTEATAETSTIRFINDACNNTMKYCKIKGSSKATYGGILYFSTTTGTTGNDNNTIDQNDITNAADANRPINAIGGIGTSGKENSGNMISNNNIYDFLNRSTISYGINLWNNNTSWSITGNSFYETASFVPTASVAYYVINIYYTNGSGFTVNNNYIGGQASGCGGTAWTKTGAFNNAFIAIYLNVGTGTATSVQGNTIRNFVYSNSLNASWYGINILAGAVNTGTTTGNTIGATSGEGSITLTNTTAGGCLYGISIAGSGTTNTLGNTIGSLTAGNASGTNNTNICGIYSGASGTADISNNTIGSTSTANSLNATSASTGNAQYLWGINIQGSGSSTISGNIIANLKNSCTGSSAQLFGILTSGGAKTITNNTIRDLTVPNSNASPDYMSSILGICNQATSAANTISGNTIYNLSNTNASFAGNVIGLWYQGSTTASTVSKNFIHSLTVASTTSMSNIYGIKIYNGATTWSNNIISIGSGLNTNIFGIYENGDAGNNNNLYFNTIYIGGDLGAYSVKSYALYSATSTNTRDFRNNIFDNQRFIGAKSPDVQYANYAAWFNYGVSTNLTLDNNDYYVSATGGSSVLGYFNNANVPSLPLISGQDANSKSVDPAFASAGGTSAPNYLPSNTSLIAATGTGITTDYASTARSVTYPSMGAYEYNVAPIITVTSTLGTPTAYYSTLKAAFDAINAGTHQGVITVKINNSTTETSTAVLYASGSFGKAPTGGGSSYTSVNIYPTSSVLSVTGNLAAPLIDLNGADNVTIDGRVNATGSTIDLVIKNTSTSTTLGTSTIRFISDASNNTVKYCTLKGSQMIQNIPGYGSGIIYFSTGTTTGNDGNLIDHNNITNAADANRPINAIFSLGTSAKENSGNTISNNNIYDFLIRDASFTTGICIRDNNTNWTISGNSFYESASFAATGSESYYFIIYIESGSAHTVSSNYIGGSGAACSGTWIKTGSFQHEFIGICINSPSTGNACEIQGNIIRNISWTNGSGNFTGIKIAGSIGANIGTTTPNVIGATTGNGNITYTLNTTNTGQTCYGITATSTGTVWIQNNTMGAITTNNSNTGYPANFYGIHSSGTGGRVINANTIGSTAEATTNSIYASSPSTGASQTVYGIYSEGSGNTMIIANTVSKLTNGTTNTDISTPGLINGITTTGGINEISGNMVMDLTIANASTAAFNTASVIGISLNNTTAAVQTITRNTIYNLSNTYASFEGNVIGLYYNGSTTSSSVSGNFIHSLSLNSANTAASIYGIRIDGGSASFSNNIISLGTGITTGYNIYGIKLLSAGTNALDLFYNTVYIGGTASGATSNSYALSNGNGGYNFRTYKNNIFSNSRAGGSGGKHYAVSVAVLDNLIIDYNDYYAPNGILGFLAGDKTDLAAWKAATLQDIHSLNTNPGFASAGGTLAANYLPSNTSLIAVTGTGITTDYSGTARSETSPSMGAWEYNVSSAVTVTATSGTLTGVYPTLKAAFDAINNGTHQGVITIMINSSTTETASAVLRASGFLPGKAPVTGGSNYTSVNVYPTVTGLSISGNLETPLIDLNGADNVTIDGRVNQTGGKSLIITNTSTATSVSGGISAIRFINDACSNTVKYCTIKASSASTNSGIIYFSTTTGSTGNDNNTIDNNDITNAADANRPVNAIYSLGTVGKENSGNIITTNNIYDFLNRGLNSQGINLSTHTTSCTISGNSFYETAAFVPTAEIAYKGIAINNAGVNFTVSGNYIGGRSAACGGDAWTKTNAFDNDFYAIHLVVGTATASNIQGNTIKNFSWSNPGSKHTWCGIAGYGGSINIGTTSGNTIGAATGTASINYNAGTDEGYFYGISLSGDGEKDVQSNQIGSVTMAGSDPMQGHRLYGIFNMSTGTVNISLNTIGSETTAGSINLTSPSASWSQAAVGILNMGTGTVTISGNHIANITNGITSSDPANRGLIHGILAMDGSNTISNNIVRDLTIANANNAADYSASVIGIALDLTTAAAQSITGNTIYNLSNAKTDFAGNVIGLYYEGSTTASTASGNFIHSLSVASPSTTSANIYGIKIQNGKTTWSNNIISVGSNYKANIYGMYERGDAGNDNNLYYNTIYISGTVESTNSKSYALYSATSTNTRNFRNNIFDNRRGSFAKSPGGFATNYAAWFDYGVSTNLTLDNNDYYASGNGGVLGYYNSANVIDLPLITGMDANSKSVDPVFASAGGTLAVDYLPAALGLIAATGTGITTDYVSTTRSLTTPSMGAWEYNANSPVTVTSTAGSSPAFYSTLKAAFDAINSGTHQGAITVKIDRSTTESASAVLRQSGFIPDKKAPVFLTSNYTSVIVYPTVTGLSISGNLATPLIDLNGADNVTIDGRVNATGSAKDLVITNTSLSSTAGTSTIRFINDASSDLIQYCKIKGSSTDASAGIIFFSTAGTGTGNDANTIDHNDITCAADANRPINAIYSLGTDGKENSSNTISSNNIYDFLNRGLESRGIYLYSYTTAWTISGNSFYETASFVSTASVYYYAININCTAGTGFTVNNNNIGGQASGCGGTAWTKSGAFNNVFTAINLNVGTGTATSVQGNTIQNFSCSTTGTRSAWNGIAVVGGNVNVGTTTGNTIGDATGTGSITFNSGADQDSFYGILLSGEGTKNIEHNQIGSITMAGTDPTKGKFFIGIYNTASGTTIVNNTIGSGTTANSINLSSPSTVEEQTLIGIWNQGTGSVTISGNTIANMKNGTTNATTTKLGLIHGVLTRNGSNTISDNTIRDLTIANANTAVDYMAPVIGIALDCATAVAQSITGNTMYNLRNIGGYGAVNVIGLYYNGSTTSSAISGNFIHGLSLSTPGKSLASQVAGSVYGIKINAGSATYSNNIISLGDNTPITMYGIYETGEAGNDNNLYYNTIYIYGNVASFVTKSYALYSAASTNTRNFRNNIFYNQRSSSLKNPNTPGYSNYAAWFNYNVSTNLTLDNNDYYAPGNGGALGYYNSAVVFALPIISGMDGHSKAIDPLFASAGGSSAANYLPSETSLVAVTGTGITTDYAGIITRSLTYPAMGAWEYTVSPPCANPTSGGAIADNQTGCSPFDPALLTNTTSPAGQTGTLEYKWQKSTTSSITGFTDIASSNSATYDPPAGLTATTWYKRLARVDCMADWTGAQESNVVQITIDPASVGGSIEGSATVCSGTNSTLLTLSGYTGSILKWQKSTDNWTTPVDVANTTTTLTATNLTTTTKYRAVVQSGVCSSANSSDATVTVDPVSVGGSIEGSATVCSGTNSNLLTLSGYTGSILKWQKSTDNWTTPVDVANTTTTLTATNLTTTTKYRAVVQSGVCSTVNSSEATVNVNPNGQVNQPADQMLCNAASTNAVIFSTNNTGGITTYAWTNNAPSIGLEASGNGNIASFTAINTSAAPVVATIVVMPTFNNGGVNCTGPTKSFTITVNPTAQVDQPASQVLCNTAATTAVSFGTVNSGGTTTYAWINDASSIGLADSGNGNIASFTAINTSAAPVVATIVVMPTFNNGGVNCTGPTKSFTITVNPTAQVDQPASQVLCNTAATTAVSFGTVNSGGTTTYAWINDASSIGLADSGNGNIASFTAINTSAAPVVATIVVTPTFTNGGVNCTGPTKSFTIIVNPTAQVNTISDQVLCNTAATTAVSFGTVNSGGTTTYAWINNTPSIGLAASGSSNIASFTAVNAGTSPVVATIVVTPTFNNGGVNCTGPTKSFTITVNPTAQVDQPASQVVCNTAATAAVTFTTTGSGGTVTYAWTNDTPSIGLAASGTGNIASFTAINTGTLPVVATIVVTPTFNNGGVNCTGPTKSFTITVNPTAQVNTISDQVLCNTAATTAVSFGTVNSGGTVTYAWTNDTPSIGLAASGTGNIASFTAINTGTAPVVATIVVTPSFINGGTPCTGPTKSFTITVNPSGQVIHPESQAVCHGEATAAVVFETLNSGGTTVYTWTNDIPSIGLAAWGTGNIASFIATNTTPGPVVATITVTPTFSNGGVTCYGDAKSFKITVNPLVLVNQPLGQVVCNTAATSAVTFETTNTGGISTYNWTNDTPSIGLAASGTGDIASFTAVNTSASPVVATIVVTPTFTNSGISCTGAAKSFTITVNPTAQVDQPASQVLCNTTATAAISFGTVNSGGTTTYAWTNDTPSIGLAASGTGNIASFTAVNTGTSPVVATIVVIPIFTNGGVNCTGPTKSFTITVNPTAQVDQPANQVLCNTAATTAISFGTVNTGGTTTFEWTNDKPSIGLAASGTGSIASFTAVNTGTSPVVATIVVTPTFNNGGVNCTGPTKSFTITVNPTAQVDQPLDQVLCHSATTDPVTFWTANTGGTATYEWTNDTPSIGLAASGTGNIASFTAVNTGTAPVMATIVVTPTFNNGGVNCTGPTKSFTITVNPLPVPTISGTTNLCVNSGYYIYTTEPGMTNYNWTISPGGSFYWGLGTNELWVTWNTMGAQWVGVTYTNQNSCAAQSATLLNITVSPMPAPAGSITGETTLCAGTQGVVYSTPPIQDAVTYIWNLPPGATIESGDSTTSIVVNYALNAASGNITVYGNNFCGNGPSSSLPVTVNPIPAPPIVTALGDTLTSNAQQGNQWYYSPTQGGSGSAIQGATDPTYLATVTGWYWSQVTLYECVSDTSNHEYVLITGIEEMPGVRFVVYPVPNDGIFMTEITTTDERTFDMQIFDQIGKMIYEKRKIRVQGKFEQKVDLRPIPVGIYTIVFRNEGGLVIRKMLISN